MSLAWRKVKETEVKAQDTVCGVFNIRRNGGLWWANVSTRNTLFKFPPCRKLDEAKRACEAYAEKKQGGQSQ